MYMQLLIPEVLYLPTAGKGNVFRSTSHSVHGGYDFTSCLDAWSHVLSGRWWTPPPPWKQMQTPHSTAV